MGTCRKWQCDSRQLARERKTPSRGCLGWRQRPILRRLLGVDSNPLHRLSGLQVASWCPGRIQRQIYVGPDDLARGILCDARESLTRDLPQLLSAGDAVAI